jgi:hypothetical protein
MSCRVCFFSVNSGMSRPMPQVKMLRSFAK